MPGFFLDKAPTASDMGWMIGLSAGTIIDLIFIIMIARAPSLAIPIPPKEATPIWRRIVQVITVAIGAAILAGGCWKYGHAGALDYATAVAFGMSLPLFVVISLAMFTAANQVGTRGVR